MRFLSITLTAAGVLAVGASAQAGVKGPYTADANTLHLYHFDEAAGPADPGTPFADSVVANPYPLTNTGGPDGRDNTGAGGYAAPAFSGFGSAFDALNSGTGAHTTTTTPAVAERRGDRWPGPSPFRALRAPLPSKRSSV